jgi:hypothetical protein
VKVTRPSTRCRSWNTVTANVLERPDLHGCSGPREAYGGPLHRLPELVGQSVGQ